MRPTYPRPTDELRDYVGLLFHSAKTLTDASGRSLFAASPSGKPRVQDVHAVFINLHQPLSNWNTAKPRKQDGPHFQLNFTNKLARIFSNSTLASDIEEGRFNDFVVMYQHWSVAHPTELAAANKQLASYIDVLVKERNATVDKQIRERMTSVGRALTIPSERLTPEVRQSGQHYRLPLEIFAQASISQQQARNYLRGAAPSFSDAIHVAVRRDSDIRNIMQTIDSGAKTIQVAAPIGEGVTTVLMQVAHEIMMRRDVASIFWYGNGTFPKAAPDLQFPHYIILDDAHDIDVFPEWLTQYSNPGSMGVVLAGCRTLGGQRAFRASRLKWARVSLSKVLAEDAEHYVEKIMRYGAADQPSLDLKALFQSALIHTKGVGGLFPAMFAATRGELLEARYRRLVDSLAPGDSLFDVLAIVIFCNRVLANAHRAISGPPSRALLRVMADEIGAEPRRLDAIKQGLSSLPDPWDGEIRLRRNIEVEVRHETINDILFRWIFGAAELGGVQRGDIRCDKWSYYSALARAIIELRGRSSKEEVLAVIGGAVHLLRYDIIHGVPMPDPIASAATVLDMIAIAEVNIETEGADHANLQISRARVHTFLLKCTTSPEDKARNKGSALRYLSLAARLSMHNHTMLRRLGEALRELPQPAVVTLPDGNEVYWHYFFSAAAKEAEGVGDFSAADAAAEAYLRRLLRKPVANPDWKYKTSTFDRLVVASSKARFPANKAFDNDRLVLLCAFARWSIFPYKTITDEVWRLPIGIGRDEFGTSRRSIYREIWRELYRIYMLGALPDLIENGGNKLMLDRLGLQWNSDEAGDQRHDAWPEPRIRFESVLGLIKKANWQSIAIGYSVYFPGDH